MDPATILAAIQLAVGIAEKAGAFGKKDSSSGSIAEGGGTIKDQMPVKQTPSAPLMGFPSVSNTNYGDIVKAVVNRQRGGMA